MDRLLPSALAPSTCNSYRCAWSKFASFAKRLKLSLIFPIPVKHLSCFICFLFNEGMAVSSVNTILSALSYFHKLNNFVDYTHSFAVKQLVMACQKVRPSADSRLPISEGLLQRMFDIIPNLGLSKYDSTLFQAIFLLAFYFALRVGEFTDSRHNINRDQVVVTNHEITLKFLSYKHSANAADTHYIKAKYTRYCVVGALLRFLNLRGNGNGPLFSRNKKPISKQVFSGILKRVVSKLGLQNANLKAHSFRIGAASHWAQKGFSEVQIRKMGRWLSNAMDRYIRGDVKHVAE